jgi:hypothetical protein
VAGRLAIRGEGPVCGRLVQYIGIGVEEELDAMMSKVVVLPVVFEMCFGEIFVPSSVSIVGCGFACLAPVRFDDGFSFRCKCVIY